MREICVQSPFGMTRADADLENARRAIFPWD
jgi:hypothetical protein